MTTYTVTDGQDSSWFRPGLSLDEAQALAADRGERFEIMTDEEFATVQSRPEDGYEAQIDSDGVTRIIRWK